MSDTTGRTAAELGRAYTECLAARDAERALELFADDVVWDFQFALRGVPSRLDGRDEVGRIVSTVLGRQMERIEISDLSVIEVDDGLAVVEFRSTGVTVKGEAYGNRYCVIVGSRDGRITTWREYFDPRAVEVLLERPSDTAR